MYSTQPFVLDVVGAACFQSWPSMIFNKSWWPSTTVGFAFTRKWTSLCVLWYDGSSLSCTWPQICSQELYKYIHVIRCPNVRDYSHVATGGENYGVASSICNFESCIIRIRRFLKIVAHFKGVHLEWVWTSWHALITLKSKLLGSHMVGWKY